MKVILSFLLWAMMMPVWAQPSPQHPSDAQREQRAYERDQRTRGNNYELSNQWSDRERGRNWRERARWCSNWRERVRQHPRLILPRECWRR